MRILLLNQTFYPDVVSTSQHLTPFALALKERGHEVSVVCSRRGYDDVRRMFPARERWNGVEIYRVHCTGFGKGAKWKRAVDFGSFLLSCLWRVAAAPRADVVVALTSPPLISFIGACYARLRGGRFVYWVMDMNPDAAVAAGWLREGSLSARVLHWVSRFSFRHASRIIALDRFMADRIAAKGIDRKKIAVIPPWSQDDVIGFDAAARERWRDKQGLANKFIVMYSGNHSPCNPLGTLLAAARALKGDARFEFLFVGGGSEFTRIKQMAAAEQLSNVRCLPYEPLSELSGSLSAADLHVVSLGDSYVGIIHPCKIYNILSVEAPVLYLGPEESHITEIFQKMDSEAGRNRTWYTARHGDLDAVLKAIHAAAEANAQGHGRGDRELYAATADKFAQGALLPRQVELIEQLGDGH